MIQKDINPDDVTQFGLNIYQYGHEVCVSQHRYGPAVRQHYLLHYVIRGCGVLHTERQRWPVQQGEAFLIYPHDITTYVADKRAPWEYMWIELDGLMAARSLEKCGLRRDMPLYRPKNPDSLAEEGRLLQQLIAEEPQHSLRITGLTCLFLDALIVGSASSREATDVTSISRHLEHATQFIERNYHRPFTIAEVAACCNIDRSYLSRLFQQQFGYGPKHYLLQLRMNVAISLLADRTLPVKIIAYSVGYSSQMQFAKVFHHYFNCSPSEWRAKATRRSEP